METELFKDNQKRLYIKINDIVCPMPYETALYRMNYHAIKITAAAPHSISYF